MLHNRYLPDWLHRAANGIFGSGLSSLVAIAAMRILGAPLWILWLVLPVALLCTVLDPRRFSLVEGCAGDIGYDELLGDEATRLDDSEGRGNMSDV